MNAEVVTELALPYSYKRTRKYCTTCGREVENRWQYVERRKKKRK